MKISVWAASALAAIATGAAAQAMDPVSDASDEPLSLDGLMGRFAWSFDAAVTSQKVGEGLYVLFGVGGNVAASIGPDGVLIVDNMFPQMVPKVEAAIRELGGGSIDYAINTHWHFDHADGNQVLGPAGTWIVAHQNSADMMAKTNILNLVVAKYRQPAYPPKARPGIAFEDRMRLYFNGEVDIVHPGPAHTGGDAAVIFRDQNAVHFGDVFNNTGYPFIDADSGGDVDGMIDFCQSVLDELAPDAIVIPGHGEVTDTETLAAYIAMIAEVRDRVQAHIDDGKTMAEVIAAKPTADFDEVYGSVEASLGFVDRVYTSLTRKAGG